MVPLHTSNPTDSHKDAPHHAAHQLTPLSCPKLHTRHSITTALVWHSFYFRPLLQQIFFFNLSAHNCDKMILQPPCIASATFRCFTGCHKSDVLNLFLPPNSPHQDIANQQQNPQRSAEKKSHHHMCSTDDFIPITCSCHAKRATGEKKIKSQSRQCNSQK